MMFALGIEFLMGRAVISRWDNRQEPEWPPHPDRVFMALVAAWGESGEDAEGKAALLWLEALTKFLGPPALRVSTDVRKRTSFTNYVPVNDHYSPISKKGKAEPQLGSMPFGRARNARFFPAIVPHDPTVHLIWSPVVEDPKYLPALVGLCRQVTYLGHSSTPIRMWVETRAVEPNLVPMEGDAPLRLRVFGPGRLETLERCFNRAQIDEFARLSLAIDQLDAEVKVARGNQKREMRAKLAELKNERTERFGDVPPQVLRPVPSLWQGYGSVGSESADRVIEGPFDPGLIVMRQIGGRKFSLESCGLIVDAVRMTLMSRHGTDPPEWLSGHRSNGAPSTIRRLAYMPLAFVDHEHADGHLLGIALAVPRTFTEEGEIRHLWKLLAQHGRPDIGEEIPYLSLKFRGLELELELDESGDRNIRQNLRPSVWCTPMAGSKRWATVTPLVLPLVPRRALTVEAVIARACTDAGLPEPISVRASLAPLISGVPHARSFRFDSRSQRPRRPVMHAEVQFPQPVRGPIIIGAGRYAGYGICRPRRDEEPA